MKLFFYRELLFDTRVHDKQQFKTMKILEIMQKITKGCQRWWVGLYMYKIFVFYIHTWNELCGISALLAALCLEPCAKVEVVKNSVSRWQYLLYKDVVTRERSKCTLWHHKGHPMHNAGPLKSLASDAEQHKSSWNEKQGECRACG